MNMGHFKSFKCARFYIFKVFCILLAAIYLSSSFSSCSLSQKSKKVQAPALVAPTKPEFTFVKVKKAGITRTSYGAGTFVSSYQQNLFFSYQGGYLKGIYVQQGDMVKKGDILAELETNELENQIVEQKVKLQMAQLNYEELKSSGAEKFDVDKALLSVELEKVTLDNLQQKMNKTRLVAQIDGMVTFVLMARIGESVKPFDTMVTISDTKDLQIEYSGRYLNEMKVGMKVTADYKNEFYSGIVASITGNRSTAIGDQVAYITIRLDKLPKEAKVGENVKIAIDITKKENILVIPSSAVHVFDKRPYVILLENGVRTERYIETGLADEMSVEVISGLKEGEEIIAN